MDEHILLELLRELEWCGVNMPSLTWDHGTKACCPKCGSSSDHHEPDCPLLRAINFVQSKCERQDAWDLIARDLGPGQVIAMPLEPRAYGGWSGKSWLVRVGGELITQPTERLMRANLIALSIDPNEAREIGPDGLPVPEPPENE